MAQSMEFVLPLCTAFPNGALSAKRFHLLSQNGSPYRVLSSKKLLQVDQEGNVYGNDSHMDNFSKIPSLSRKKSPHVAEELLTGTKSKGILLNSVTLSSMMIYYANNGLMSQAEAIWDNLLSSSFVPSVVMVAQLIEVYATSGHFHMVTRILKEVYLQNSNLLPDICVQVISSFGKKGELKLMEIILKEMTSMGFSIDSVTANAYVIYFSIFGTLDEMEVAYARLKRSQILIEEEAIRAISSAYIKERKFYNLRKFVEDVGPGRRNVGNLLWNLILLSYAANFKMKSLQREFVRMVEGGFHPDLTTFNIRALAFSKMSLFWDLHLSLQHLKHESVAPDLVTYGCLVDAYSERRLLRNLDFALSKLNTGDSVTVSTDQLVFEVMGKGDFHSSSEAFLEFKNRSRWTYKELIEIYRRKKLCSNQVFWNY